MRFKEYRDKTAEDLRVVTEETKQIEKRLKETQQKKKDQEKQFELELMEEKRKLAEEQEGVGYVSIQLILIFQLNRYINFLFIFAAKYSSKK